MALSTSTMKQTIIDEMDAVYGPPEDETEQDKFASAMAAAMLEILTNQAVVNVTSVSGVTTGPGVSGPGTGAIA